MTEIPPEVDVDEVMDMWIIETEDGKSFSSFEWSTTSKEKVLEHFLTEYPEYSNNRVKSMRTI